MLPTGQTDTSYSLLPSGSRADADYSGARLVMHIKGIKLIKRVNYIRFLYKSTLQIAPIRVFSFLPAKKVVIIYHFIHKKSLAIRNS